MKTCKAYLSLFIFLCAVVARGDDIRQYSYDAKGRLSAVTVLSDSSKNESYKYDSRGNVVEQTVGSATYQFSYDKANQLTSRLGPDGLRHYTYDRAGRLIAESLNGKIDAKYTYGYLDKVTSVERDGQITQFRYNADGMLMEKEYPDGHVEKWGWDGMALISRGDERYVNEPHMSGGVPLMGGGETRGVRYHINDYLGTTLLSLDAQGNVSDTYEDTTAFGQGDSLKNDPAARFTGKPYDKDLGAFVFPFRNYNPENARWTTVDPSGFPDGPNAHFYAGNPLLGVDPLGLAWDSADMVVYYYRNLDPSGASYPNHIDTDVMGLTGGIKQIIDSQILPGFSEAVDVLIRNLVLTGAGTSGDGSTSYEASGGYQFGDLVWALGGGTVVIKASNVSYSWNEYVWETTLYRDYSWSSSSVTITYSDSFADPLDIGIEPLGRPYSYSHVWKNNHISGSGIIELEW